MGLVASVDYTTRRIYLSAESVDANLDTMDIYHEVRALRVATGAHQRFKPIISAGGNLQKLPGVYTPAYVVLVAGCYIVPYDSAQRLKIIRDTFAVDGRAGRDCFDRTTVSSNVDIDVDFPEIEIREVVTGGGGSSDAPTAQQVATAVRVALATELSRIDTTITSRQPSGVVDANITKVNGVTITGSGIDGVDEWRRA